MGKPKDGQLVRPFSAEHLAPYADRLRALRVVDDLGRPEDDTSRATI
jgi:hypothetical protein